MVSSEEKDFTEWFNEYTAADANKLTKNSKLIQAVNSDDLDANFVEQHIRDSAPKSPVTKGFCAKCQDLFNNWPTLGGSSTREHDSKPDLDQEGWDHGVARPCSTFELEGSTRAGCKFCTFLLQQLKDSKLLDTFRKIETRLYHLNDSAVSFLSVQNWGTNPLQLLWLNLPGKICTSCNSGIAAAVKFQSSFLPASADCYDELPDVLDTVGNWLSTCSEGHELCTSKDDGILPSRLVSIAGDSPRLILTSAYQTRPRYSTLSHSWGSHDVIKLTSKDLDAFMKVIPVDRLPPTFKDAIKITRSLGLDHCWIDSLCIIQDSEEDWLKESALMSSVYGGSTINIAASSAVDSSQGCFMKPPDFSGGLRARIIDGGRERVQDFRSSEVYDLSTSKTHLGSRAWALQEKMLPPRTIHFGDRGAFWECRTTIASEYLPDGFPRHLVSPLVRGRGKFESLWRQVVMLYSAANLTFEKDKLPALSGVARLGFNETGDQYLAGLWRRQILEQLCWRRWKPKTNWKRLPWRAPSWSWASIDGKVTWRYVQEGIMEDKYAHVLDASTTLYGHDPFGQVSSGVIRLACSAVATGFLVPSMPASNSEGETGAIVVLRASNEEQQFPIQMDCLDDIDSENKKPIYIVPLLGGKTGSGMAPHGEVIIDELVIQGVALRGTGVRKGEFSRIGTFDFYKDRVTGAATERGFNEYYDLFLQVLEEHGTATAEAACAEIISNSEHPKDRYVITIV